DYELTKIEGPINDKDVNLLVALKEVSTAVASIPTTNVKGQKGHFRLIIDDADYIMFLHNWEHFIDPVNPGLYPVVVNNNIYLTCEAVEEFLCKLIIKLVDKEWIMELVSETMGCQHRHP
ncbi:hypothetical protein ACHAW6_001956, partial [Cyclotella cf. meneghiniana]